MTRIALILALLFSAPWEAAETVEVQDQSPVDLARFDCQDITRSSVISRVCYDRESRRMLVQRHAVYRQYCGVPHHARDALLNAPSMGRYFKTAIEPAGRDGKAPYGCATGEAPSVR
jgi:hypothetical protein